MDTLKTIRRMPAGLLAGTLVLTMATGGTAAWWMFRSSTPSSRTLPIESQPSPSSQASEPAIVPSPAAQPSPEKPVQSAPVERTAQVYWLKNEGNRIALAPARVALGEGRSDEMLKSALEALLAGPKEGSVATTIPEATRLLSVATKPDGIHVDLSKAFTTGGGSASMTGRVAQILYTATTLQPGASVWIEVDGKPLEVLGGEGLVLDQPLTRKSFEENFEL